MGVVKYNFKDFDDCINKTQTSKRYIDQAENIVEAVYGPLDWRIGSQNGKTYSKIVDKMTDMEEDISKVINYCKSILSEYEKMEAKINKELSNLQSKSLKISKLLSTSLFDVGTAIYEKAKIEAKENPKKETPPKEETKKKKKKQNFLQRSWNSATKKVKSIGNSVADTACDFGEWMIYEPVGEKWKDIKHIGNGIGKDLKSAGKTAVEVGRRGVLTGCNACSGFTWGLADFGEGLYDGLTYVGTALLSPHVAALDVVHALECSVTGNEYDSLTVKWWERAAGSVKTDIAGYQKEKYYKKNGYGDLLKEDSYAYEAVNKTSETVGYISGAIMTGGAGIQIGTASMAISGIGNGSEDALKSGATIGESIISGAVQGIIDGASYLFGAKLGQKIFGQGSTKFDKVWTKIFGDTATVKSNVANVAIKSGADMVDGAVNTLAQPAIQKIYRDESYSELFQQNGGYSTLFTNMAIAGSLSAASEGLELKNKNKSPSATNTNKTKSTSSVNKVERVIDDTHGYQLNNSDLSGFFEAKLKQGFFSQKQIDDILSKINKKGYLSAETGNYIKNLFDDNYDIYVKTVNSVDLDSIMEKGIYCNGTATSIGGGKPTSIKEINLDNTITQANDMLTVVDTIKTANGLSQGSNPIDGTVILKIPKGTDLDDIIIKSGDTFAIDPKYIDGYVGVDAKGNVGEYKHNPSKNNLESIDSQIADANYAAGKSRTSAIRLNSLDDITLDHLKKIKNKELILFKLADGTTYNYKDISEIKLNNTRVLESNTTNTGSIKSVDETKNIQNIKEKSANPVKQDNINGNAAKVKNKIKKSEIMKKLEVNKTNLIEGIVDKIPPELDNISKMRVAYLKLNQLTTYSDEYIMMEKGWIRTDFTKKNNIYNRFYDITDIGNSNRIVCSNWAQMYKDVLEKIGIDPQTIKIVGEECGKSGVHRFVTIDIGKNRTIVADGAYDFFGKDDLIRSKLGLETEGFNIVSTSDINNNNYNEPIELRSLGTKTENYKIVSKIDSQIGYKNSEYAKDFNNILKLYKKKYISLDKKIEIFKNVFNNKGMSSIDQYSILKSKVSQIFGKDTTVEKYIKENSLINVITINHKNTKKYLVNIDGNDFQTYDNIDEIIK